MDRWHVALIEPQSEQIASRVLRARGYEVYHPTFPKPRRWGGVGSKAIKMMMRPMFPGYLFVNESVQGWHWLRSTPGVRKSTSLLMINDTYAVLPEGEIQRIAETQKRLVNQIVNAKKYTPFAVGDIVRVTGGPFAGFYATIETLDDHERIALLMDIFRRKSRVFASHNQIAAP